MIMSVTTERLVTKSAQRARDILDQLAELETEMGELASWRLRVDEITRSVGEVRQAVTTVHERLTELDASLD
jgi:ubiquinone biosynthesis protein UbiJ